MTLFKVRDLTVNIATSPAMAASPEDGSTVACFNAASIHPPGHVLPDSACDDATIACFNAASIHPPPRMMATPAACDEGTIACFNAASIHPPKMMEMIAAIGSDASATACFNAGSLYPPDVIRAVVPLSASDQDLAALKAELRAALERLETGKVQASTARAPQTLAEIDLLKRELSGALEELGTQRLAIEHKGH